MSNLGNMRGTSWETRMRRMTDCIFAPLGLMASRLTNFVDGG